MQTITFLNGFTLTFELSAVALLRSTNALIFAWIGGVGGGLPCVPERGKPSQNISRADA